MARTVQRFYGEIAGAGSTSGVRVVVGRWERSPYGAFADVMLEQSDGRRVLLAPSDEIADFVTSTYTFEEVRVGPVQCTRAKDSLIVTANALRLHLEIGGREALGRVLRAQPSALAASPAWNRLLDPLASRVVPGVHTAGTARPGRREYYGGRDLRVITSLSGEWEGNDLGGLAPVEPPVRFGFSSAPPRPGITRVVTTIVSRETVGSGQQQG